MELTLTLPPALNRCFRAGVTRSGRPYQYKTKQAKRWQETAWFEIKQQYPGFKSIESKVEVEINLFLKRDRDIDSSHKLLLDTLEMANIIKNDRQIVKLVTTKEKSDCDKVIVNVNNLGATTS